MRYRQGPVITTIVLLVVGGFTTLFTYLRISHYRNGTESWTGFLWAAFLVIVVIGVVRTTLIGPRFDGTELQIPHAFRRTTRIPVQDIAGIYIGRITVNMYNNRGWVPLIWTRQHRFVTIRGLTSMAETRDPALLLNSHMGQAVSDLYKRVEEVQGSSGLLATTRQPSLNGLGITVLINPGLATSIPHDIDQETPGSPIHFYPPHDPWAVFRGVLCLVVCVVLFVIVIVTFGNPNTWTAVLSNVGCIFAGAFAWRSLRTFLHRSSISTERLHIRSPLREAVVHTEDIAGIGVIGRAWRKGSSRWRWVPVVWTATSVLPMPNVVSFARHDASTTDVLATRSGDVAHDIRQRVLLAQTAEGLIHQNLKPPPHPGMKIIRLGSTAATAIYEGASD